MDEFNQQTPDLGGNQVPDPNQQYAQPQYQAPQGQPYQAPEQQYQAPQGEPYQQTINVNMPQYPQGQRKSKMAAGLLGIFLGVFGVHNFYLGYTGKAIAQLLISILSCGILAVASEIWGLVEGIMILTGSINVDANGVPLSE